jgi:hypothetical protein
MSDYAVLILPAMNRVYAESSVALTQAELGVLNQSVLGGRLHGIASAVIAGVSYVRFSADGLTQRDMDLLANLSSLYALFEVRGALLEPIAMRRLDKFGDDLMTIQKYSGKTNEQFTKLLLNVTLFATEFGSEILDRKFHIFDPMCGRGTTLNQALLYGFDASGVEIDGKDFDAYELFLLTWLKNNRLKHDTEQGPKRNNSKGLASRLRVNIAASKESYKSGQTTHVTVINADTVRAAEFFGRQTFDAIVTDAPYGVQHGSRTEDKGLTRSPLELLSAALPVWIPLLKPGGAVGIAWNTRVAKRELVVDALEKSGLIPQQSEAFLQFKHRVDQSIQRDIVVGRKPGLAGTQ